MGLCYARIAGVAKSTPLKGMAMVSGVSLPFGPPAGFSLWPSPVVPAGMFSDGGANFVTATEIVASVSGTYTDVKILAFGASGVGTIEGILYVHNTQTTASLVTETGAIAANSGTLGDWFNIALPAGGVHVAATVPVTVGLVVDHSTTMRPKLEEVITAARTFVRSSNREDEMFVVNFNEIVSLGLPGTIRFTDSAAKLENAITAATSGGQTALYDAIAKGLEELQAGSRDKKVLIVVSDGGDNASVRSLGEIMNLAQKSSAMIYTVGVFDEDDPDRNPAVLKRLARATGGEAFFAGQLSEVVAICERIARDIRHQYTIGYVPLNLTRDGAYRTIRVLARAKGHDRLSVRTRTGYIAGGEPGLGEKVAK